MLAHCRDDHLMRPLSYALVTPSFRGDFERCRLLVESVGHWVSGHVRHYLVVDRRDAALFSPLANARTQVLIVEDIVPWWLLRVPGVPKVWLSLRTRPVRNWMLQQLVKLSMASVLQEDVLLFADSDVFFCAPFEPRDLEREGRVPLFVETGQRGLIDFNDRWHNVAARLLGLPEGSGYDTNFVGNIICWRRDHALALQRRIAEVGGRDWPLMVAPQAVISEYILYGLFVTRLLGEQSGHWHDGVIRCLPYWQTTPLDSETLQHFKSGLQPFQFAVMISAKSHTPVEAIRRVFAG